jgi:hypothetical protein
MIAWVLKVIFLSFSAPVGNDIFTHSQGDPVLFLMALRG